jgi:DNA-binding transcriptional LysR family regulator
MHPPSLAETNAFVAVVQQKSFTRAAKQLGLSPPRVSEMVRNLEEELGVRLVERTTRSVAATAAGERLLERLRPVLDDYQAALESTNEFRSKPSGTLRLNVAPPAADFVLADAIPRFLAVYPEISVDICVDSEFTDIVAERFDAGIRNGERLERDMIAVRVSGEMPIVVAAAPAYLARRGTPKTPQEVAAHDCIRFRLPSGALFPWRFRFKRRSLDVHVQGRLAVNDRKIALACARRRRPCPGAARLYRSRNRGRTPCHRARRLGAAAGRRVLSVLPKPPSDSAGSQGACRLSPRRAPRRLGGPHDCGAAVSRSALAAKPKADDHGRAGVKSAPIKKRLAVAIDGFSRSSETRSDRPDSRRRRARRALFGFDEQPVSQIDR